MQIFEKIIVVKKDDLDDLNHVNNVRYVQWIQDVAKAHWELNTTTDVSDTYFWVVVSHFVEYKSSALLNDNVLLKTYVTKAEGVTSTRVVEMYNNSTGKLLVKAETVWCLMNATTKKPSRITPEIANIFK